MLSQPVKQWNTTSGFRKISLLKSVLLMLWLTNWATAFLSIFLLCNSVPVFRYNWQSRSIIFERLSKVRSICSTTEEYVLLACLKSSIIYESGFLWLVSSSVLLITMWILSPIRVELDANLFYFHLMTIADSIL